MKHPAHAPFRLLFYWGAVLLFIAGCQEMRPFEGPFHRSPRERYQASLENSGLGASRLAQVWREAGAAALRDSVLVTAPFRETGYFQAARPAAVGYRLQLNAGDVLRVRLEREPDSSLLFVDLFQIVADSIERFDHRISASEEQPDSLEYEAREPGLYLLRLQPELLADLRYTLDLILRPAYGFFPVSGKSTPDIWSAFGVPRDAGRRRHEGIDIFAPRGTPVVAATDGVVTRVGERGLGGRQVWLRDLKRGHSLYYAHLDTQLVTSGQRVRAGDTLGLVGNTGNAITTAPHLHFGIYRRGSGAIDPQPFVAFRPDAVWPVSVDPGPLGSFLRIRGAAARLLTTPYRGAAVAATLPRHTPLRVIGANRIWYRVLTPTGAQGYLEAAALEPADTPLRRLTTTGQVELQAGPDPFSAPLAAVGGGTALEILGSSAGLHLARTPEGLTGWLRAEPGE